MFFGGSKLHKGAKGSVYLEEVADWSLEANQPSMIDQMTMLKIVKGVIADAAMRRQHKCLPVAASR